MARSGGRIVTAEEMGAQRSRYGQPFVRLSLKKLARPFILSRPVDDNRDQLLQWECDVAYMTDAILVANPSFDRNRFRQLCNGPLDG